MSKIRENKGLIIGGCALAVVCVAGICVAVNLRGKSDTPLETATVDDVSMQTLEVASEAAAVSSEVQVNTLKKDTSKASEAESEGAGATSETSESAVAAKEDIRPEIKAYADEYEDFFEDFIDVYKKENPSMQELEDISAKVEALENKYGQYLDPDKMNDKEKEFIEDFEEGIRKKAKKAGMDVVEAGDETAAPSDVWIVNGEAYTAEDGEEFITFDPKEIEKWLPDGFDINNATFVDGGDGSTAFGME